MNNNYFIGIITQNNNCLRGILSNSIPAPPAPTHSNYYTGHISDVGSSRYIFVWTKEKEEVE